jgi:hypothetical protein
VTQYQLRIYNIKPGTMAEFIEGWRTHIIPVREKYGFKVLYAFTNEDTNEFIWVVSHDHPEGFSAADTIYYQSPERNNMSWNPQAYVEHTELRILDGVPVHLAS